ncbi:MAG: hypothetical protein LBE13_21265 [Bacteroidales bacterium]|jgi:putative effector of murein hydrolase LrgA (UPF0299 family)|nr:hypothetical protein [Bacteroidales bacterium]
MNRIIRKIKDIIAGSLVNKTSVLFWSIFAICGIFLDRNISIQEGVYAAEIILAGENLTRFIFSENLCAHQPLYTLAVLAISRLLGRSSVFDIVIIGRMISVLAGLGSIFLVKALIKNSVPKGNPQIISCLQMFHPLFFFYAIQAEPYSLFFFWAAAQLVVYYRLSESKTMKAWYIITSSFGFFTHYYFCLLFFAEIIQETYNCWRNRKISFSPICIGLLGCLGLLVFFLPEALRSPAKYFSESYRAFDPWFLVQSAGWFIGLPPDLLGAGVTGWLTIFGLGYCLYSMQKNKQDVPMFIIAVGWLFLLLYLGFNAITLLYGWTQSFVRHFTILVVPILIGTFVNKKQGCLVFVVWSYFLLICIAMILIPYKSDILSVLKYIEVYPAVHQVVIYNNPVLVYTGLERLRNKPNILWGSASRQRVQTLAQELTAMPFSEYTQINENLPVSQEIKRRLSLDIAQEITSLEKFVSQKNTRNLLEQLAKNKKIEPDEYEQKFLDYPDIPDKYKNILLLGLLYPLPESHNAIPLLSRINSQQWLESIAMHAEVIHFLSAHEGIKSMIRPSKTLSLLNNNPQMDMIAEVAFTNATVRSFKPN